MAGKRTVKKAIVFLGVLGLLYAGGLHLKIREHAKEEPPAEAEYLIILGARVKGTVPSLALQERINKAAEYLLENENTVAIASGGKGRGEDISEAEAIKQGLVELGVEEQRILLEDLSTDTYENIANSRGLIENKNAKGLVVSNDFHLYRAKMIADDAGLIVSGLPAKTPAQALVKSYGREYLALTKYFLKSLL